MPIVLDPEQEVVAGSEQEVDHDLKHKPETRNAENVCAQNKKHWNRKSTWYSKKTEQEVLEQEVDRIKTKPELGKNPGQEATSYLEYEPESVSSHQTSIVEDGCATQAG